MNQREYAIHRGVSRGQVARWIGGDKIPKSAYKKKGRGYVIDPKKADAALAKNLDPRQRKKLSIQEKAKAKPKAKPKPTTKARKKPGGNGKAQDAAGDKGKTSVQKAIQDREYYKAELKRLEYEEKQGILIRVADVQKRAFDLGRLVRDNILSIPGRIKLNLAAESDPHEIEMALIDALTTALEDIVSLKGPKKKKPAKKKK